MVNVAQHAFVQLGFHGPGIARKTEVLRRHQQLARFIARRNHILDQSGVWREGFFADNVLARLKGGDGQRGVVIVRRANIDIWIAEQILNTRVSLGYIQVVGPCIEDLGADVAAGGEIGVFGSFPPGNMRPGNSADADNAYLEFVWHLVLSLSIRF